MLRHIAMVLAVLLCGAGSLFGQGMTPAYTGTSTFGWTSHIGDCVGSASCWHTLNGNAALHAAKLFASHGNLIALDSQGGAYYYNDYPTNSWSPQSAWGSVYSFSTMAPETSTPYAQEVLVVLEAMKSISGPVPRGLYYLAVLSSSPSRAMAAAYGLV